VRPGRAIAALGRLTALAVLSVAVHGHADRLLLESLRQDRSAASWALRLAREAVVACVSGTEAPQAPANIPQSLRGQAGVFVSLSLEGKRRGCRGYLRPPAPTIAEQIILSATAAASRDDRRRILKPEELAGLTIHVAIAGDPRRLHLGEAPDPAREGVLAEGPAGHGIILPGEARTGAWAVREARRRAGLGPQDSGVMWRFECVVFREPARGRESSRQANR